MSDMIVRSPALVFDPDRQCRVKEYPANAAVRQFQPSGEGKRGQRAFSNCPGRSKALWPRFRTKLFNAA